MASPVERAAENGRGAGRGPPHRVRPRAVASIRGSRSQGLGQSPGSAAAQPPSCVRLDAGGAAPALGGSHGDDRYGRASSASARRCCCSIDFAEPAGYLLWTRDFGRVLISPDGLELLCEPDPANDEWASDRLGSSAAARSDDPRAGGDARLRCRAERQGPALHRARRRRQELAGRGARQRRRTAAQRRRRRAATERGRSSSPTRGRWCSSYAQRRTSGSPWRSVQLWAAQQAPSRASSVT